MTSEGSLFKNQSSINSADSDFAKELEDDLLQSQSQSHGESATSEARGTSKRRGNFSKAKSTKKQRSNFYVGESSSKPKEEVLDTRKYSVPKLIRILRLRVERRIEKYKIVDMICQLWLMCNLNSTIFKVYKPKNTDSLDQMKKKWPVRSELKNIKKNIKGIEDDYKTASESKAKQEGKMKKQAAGLANTDVADDHFKQRLVQVAEEMVNTDRQLQEDSENVDQLQDFFTAEDASIEVQREKLSSAFPWLFNEDLLAINGPTVDHHQDEPSLPSRKQSVVQGFDKLFVRDDNNVKVENFQGLLKALDNTIGWKIPDYLEPIASKIKQERGEDTDFKFWSIHVLVCAAIKEMEEAAIVKLEYATLLKWGNTLKKAKDEGFQVRSAEDQLEGILAAFLAYQSRMMV